MAMTIELSDGQRIQTERTSITVGCGPGVDVVIAFPDLQPVHARISKVAGRWMVESAGDWLLQVGDSVPGRKHWLQPDQVIRLTESGVRIVFDPAGSTRLSQPKARDAVPVSTAKGKVSSLSRSGISPPRPSQPKPPPLPPTLGRTAEPVTPPWPPNQVDPRDPPVSAVEGIQRQRPASLQQFGHLPVNAQPPPLPFVGDEPLLPSGHARTTSVLSPPPLPPPLTTATHTWADGSTSLATVAQHEQKAFAAALSTATPNAFVTPTIIVLNVVVFVLMAASGAGLMGDAADALRWGANYRPLTLGGEWWRLLTSAFVHFGIFHIAFNMWALASAGLLAERLFGNYVFSGIYLVSAILGSLASLIFHTQPVVSAGASGAIFGVFGALVGYAAVQKGSVPKSAWLPLWKSSTSCVLSNLVLGFCIPGIDNAAHVGGLLAGLVGGAVLSRPLKLDMKCLRI